MNTNNRVNWIVSFKHLLIMKIKYYSKSSLSVSVFSFLLLFSMMSCDSENQVIDNDLADISVSEVNEFTEIENAEASIDEMTESLSFLMESLKNGSEKTDFKYGRIPDCATISVENASNEIIIVLDFGEECVTEKENVLAGKIIITLNYEIQNGSLMTTRTYDDFFFNDKKMEGTVSRQRYASVGGSNPYSTAQKDIKIIWEDDSYMTMTATKTREWIEGYDNMIWSDNVYLVTGESSFQKSEGNSRSVEIITPLRREMACKFFVSGTLSITNNKGNALLDYGDGTCDDLAYLTVGETTSEIHIKKRKHR